MNKLVLVVLLSMSSIAMAADEFVKELDYVTVCETQASIDKYVNEDTTTDECYELPSEFRFKTLEKHNLYYKIHVYSTSGQLDYGGPVYVPIGYIEVK